MFKRTSQVFFNKNPCAFEQKYGIILYLTFRGAIMENQTNTISTRIKELRKTKGITQKQLAEQTGLGYNSIIAYENARREPNSKAMVVLEEYFNVSGAYLRGETDKRESQQDVERKQLMIKQSNDELSDFLSRIETSIRAVSDDEKAYTDGILVEFLHTLKIKNTENRAAALFLFNLSAYISNTFFSVYDSVYNENLSQQERIEKSAHIATEYFNGSLERIKKILLQKD